MAKKELEIRDKTIFDGVIVKHGLKYFFYVWFKVAGWRITKTAPEGAGAAIAAPHTSNWDFFYALASAILMDVKIYFSIKDNWCRIPVIGSMMMWLGAIPIDRSSGVKGQVNKIKKFVDQHKNNRVFFLFTPEGTRGKVVKWKTGFYHIAQNCNLPIFMAKVDYRTKEAGVFHTFHPTGDKEEDLKVIQASYETVQGKYPDNQFPAYNGPIPKISDAEAAIMLALYSLKGVSAIGVATRVEIAAKAKISELSTVLLDFLIEKGVLEQVEGTGTTGREAEYRLTFAGKGCLFHMFPTLA